MISPFRILLSDFADFAFPPVCLACGSRTDNCRRTVCDPCLSSIVLVHKGDPVYRLARARLARGGAVADLVSVWYFGKESALRILVHHLKYGGMTRIGKELGEKLGEVILRSGTDRYDAIVPVPLHRAKLRERGYNQSEHIAHGVASVTRKPILENVIVRARFTPSQTTLTVPERRTNMTGAFQVPPRRRRDVAGKTLLLVDDVITTGATLHACASELRNAGAREVIACALALAP